MELWIRIRTAAKGFILSHCKTILVTMCCAAMTALTPFVMSQLFPALSQQKNHKTAVVIISDGNVELDKLPMFSSGYGVSKTVVVHRIGYNYISSESSNQNQPIQLKAPVTPEQPSKSQQAQPDQSSGRNSTQQQHESQVTSRDQTLTSSTTQNLQKSESLHPQHSGDQLQLASIDQTPKSSTIQNPQESEPFLPQADEPVQSDSNAETSLVDSENQEEDQPAQKTRGVPLSVVAMLLG